MEILTEVGFAPAARLSMKGAGYHVDWVSQRELDACIYVYTHDDCVLYVGHGKTLRSRIAGECGWLNGKRPKENHRPIRQDWLRELAVRPTVLIWAKSASADKGQREAEELGLIRSWNPILNKRGRRGSDLVPLVLPVPTASEISIRSPKGGGSMNPRDLQQELIRAAAKGIRDNAQYRFADKPSVQLCKSRKVLETSNGLEVRVNGWTYAAVFTRRKAPTRELDAGEEPSVNAL